MIMAVSAYKFKIAIESLYDGTFTKHMKWYRMCTQH